MRTLVTCLLLATSGVAAASPFAIRIDAMPASAHVGDAFDVRVRITNTDTVAHRIEIGCDAEAQFGSSDPELPVTQLDAAKCVEASTVLAPTHSFTRALQLGSLVSATIGRHEVALSFTPAGTHDTTSSPPRTIQLLPRGHR